MFTVKIGKMPGEIKEYVLDGAVTVENALQTAGLSANGYDIKADGRTVNLDDSLSTSTRVLVLTKRVKGNAVFTLKIGKMPGEIKEYVFESPVTVAVALQTAGLTANGYDIKLDGRTIDSMDYEITTGRVLVLTKRVKGN